MPRTRAPYAGVFREQMAELVRSGRTPGELAREFEPSAKVATQPTFLTPAAATG